MLGWLRISLLMLLAVAVISLNVWLIQQQREAMEAAKAESAQTVPAETDSAEDDGH